MIYGIDKEFTETTLGRVVADLFLFLIFLRAIWIVLNWLFIVFEYIAFLRELLDCYLFHGKEVFVLNLF